VGGGTRPADRAPRPASLGPLGQAHLSLGPMAPGPQSRLTVRAANTPTHQVRFYSGLVNPYDEHSEAPASSGRAPFAYPWKRFWRGGLLRVQVVLTLTLPRRAVKPALALLRPQPTWRRQRGHQRVFTVDGDKRPTGAQPARRSTDAGLRGDPYLQEINETGPSKDMTSTEQAHLYLQARAARLGAVLCWECPSSTPYPRYGNRLTVTRPAEVLHV
jgi:hypothetical protein